MCNDKTLVISQTSTYKMMMMKLVCERTIIFSSLTIIKMHSAFLLHSLKYRLSQQAIGFVNTKLNKVGEKLIYLKHPGRRWACKHARVRN